MNTLVKLQSFEGPLDLLLFLIRKNEIDIFNIPISEITKQYLEYLRLMHHLNLDIAGEFLVMASTLTYIKSRALLPIHNDGESDSLEEDPKEALIRKLLEYQQFQEVAKSIEERPMLGHDVFKRDGELVRNEDPQIDLEEMDIYQLLTIFHDVLLKATPEVSEIIAQKRTVQDRIIEMIQHFSEKEHMEFNHLFTSVYTKEDLILTFLGILELTRLKYISIYQGEFTSPIRLTRIRKFDDFNVNMVTGFEMTSVSTN